MRWGCDCGLCGKMWTVSEYESGVTVRVDCDNCGEECYMGRNSYYRASRAYRVYCARPEGAKRPRASTINTVRNIEAL